MAPTLDDMYFDNLHTTPLSPTSFREALLKMRGLREMPAPVYDYLVLNPHLQFDMTGIALEAPEIAQAIRLSQKENNGKVILPLSLYNDLLNRGLLVWIDDEKENDSGRN